MSVPFHDYFLISEKHIQLYTSIQISQRYLKCSNFKTKFFSTFIHLKYTIFHKIKAKSLPCHIMPPPPSWLVTRSFVTPTLMLRIWSVIFVDCFKGSAFSSSSSWIATMPTTHHFPTLSCFHRNVCSCIQKLGHIFLWAYLT